MKFVVQCWGEQHSTQYTVGPDTTEYQTFDAYEPHVVADFPVNPPGDPEREARARMLATKLCAFLNELEEKKQQLLELMTIAGSNKE